MIKIITDMAADIPANIARELDIEILPFMVIVDGKQIKADLDLTPEMYYDIVANCDEIPTTCQVSPADIEDMYRRIGKETTMIHITMSATGSGVNGTSNFVAAQLREEGFDITVIDSTMFAMAFGAAVIKAAEMAKEGKSKQEIIDYVTEVYSRDTAYFMVDDLTFLKKGGRVKATAMVVSKVLDIKPILLVRDGLVEAFRKVRGQKKAISVLVDFIEERMDNPQENEVIIIESNEMDKVEILEQMINERIKPKKITHAKIGPVITTHVGTGVVSVYFKHKKPYREYND